VRRRGRDKSVRHKSNVSGVKAAHWFCRRRRRGGDASVKRRGYIGEEEGIHQ
jgi:hypothetical protein